MEHLRANWLSINILRQKNAYGASDAFGSDAAVSERFSTATPTGREALEYV
jgi:hypothetical protein